MKARTFLRLYLTALTVLVAYVILCEAYMTIGRSACLNAGYRDLSVPGWIPFVSERYCIKRVNQTDVVVRLDSLKRAR